MDYDYELYDGNDFDDSNSYYYEEDDEFSVPNLTLSQTFETCLKPILTQSLNSIFYVLFWCFVYRVSLLIKLFNDMNHIMSAAIGILSLYAFFSSLVFYLLVFILASYVILFLLTRFQHLVKSTGSCLILISLSYMCFCELWLVEPKAWHRIRGPQMIVAMKCISLAFDIDSKSIKNIPNIQYYAGYLLNPGSCIFGPWLSYSDYKLYYNGKQSFKSIIFSIIKFLLAILCLTISTCWVEYFIPIRSWKWFSAYRDALSFRTSHYFVSYLSEATLLLSGYSNPKVKVTKPLSVEFPRSIVNVVIYWNIPMHSWLKIYVFNTSRKFGNFAAIISTYTVSSLLHGINFQLSAVLLSLGLYSYVEVMLRKKLATAFSACISAKACKPSCCHNHGKYHPLVLLTNSLFLCLTVFHLAYLGVVFESSQEEEVGYSWRHTVQKWSSLSYLSHYVAFSTYVMYFLVR